MDAQPFDADVRPAAAVAVPTLKRRGEPVNRRLIFIASVFVNLMMAWNPGRN